MVLFSQLLVDNSMDTSCTTQRRFIPRAVHFIEIRRHAHPRRIGPVFILDSRTARICCLRVKVTVPQYRSRST